MQRYEIENKEKVRLKTIKFRSNDSKLNAIQLIYTGGFESPLIQKKGKEAENGQELQSIDL